MDPDVDMRMQSNVGLFDPEQCHTVIQYRNAIDAVMWMSFLRLTAEATAEATAGQKLMPSQAEVSVSSHKECSTEKGYRK